MASIIETRQLTRRFGKTTALHPLTLDIEAGRTVGLVGDNGAGKSTLLRLLIGLLYPSDSTVSVLGLDPRLQGSRLRGLIGYVPENRALHPHVKVRKVIRHAASLSARWDARRAELLVERFGLDPSKRIRALSRGALAKLHLVMTLSARPRLLLLDEATGGIDALARRDVLQFVREVALEGETTVVFTSHVLSDVERLCDEVVLLRQGRLIEHCGLSALIERYTWIDVLFDEEPPSAPKAEDLAALQIIRTARRWRVLTTTPEQTRSLLPDGPSVEQPADFETAFIAALEARQ